MIDPAEAEAALEFLISNARSGELERVYREARAAEHMLKYEEALLVKGLGNAGVPATVRVQHARADDRWKARADTEASAYAALKVAEALRDAEKSKIMLHMSQVKDRM